MGPEIGGDFDVICFCHNIDSNVGWSRMSGRRMSRTSRCIQDFVSGSAIF